MLPPPKGHQKPRGQRYCSECGQPVPSAAVGEGKETLHAQAVSSQEGARASAPLPLAAGGAALTQTGPRPRSRPRPAAPRSEEPPSRPPTTKQWYRRPRLVVPLSILAVVVAVAAVGFGALLGGRSKSGASTQSHASSQSPVPNKQSAASKKQSPVAKWSKENGSKIQSLAISMQATASADVASPNSSALRARCQELGDSSKAAAGVLPAPNAALTNALRAATDAFEKAAQECITGVDSADPAARDRFRTDLKDGQTQVGTAASMIQQANKGG